MGDHGIGKKTLFGVSSDAPISGSKPTSCLFHDGVGGIPPPNSHLQTIRLL